MHRVTCEALGSILARADQRGVWIICYVCGEKHFVTPRWYKNVSTRVCQNCINLLKPIKHPKSRYKAKRKTRFCSNCGKDISLLPSWRKTCGTVCAYARRPKNLPLEYLLPKSDE